MNIVDFFDKIRFWGTNRNKILQKLRFYGFINKLIEVSANIVIPIYFSLTRNNTKYRITIQKANNHSIIVSITSFPKQLPTLHLVIETILRQSVKPDKIILYLTSAQIKNIEYLPKRLLSLRKRGLEIILCPDEIRSHTKYYYAFKTYPEDIIITVDDDLYYRSDLIESLLKNAASNPECIIANWVKEIIPGKNNYNEWPDPLPIQKKSKNFLILGVGGVLYPPNSVHHDIFNIENIKNLSLTADDIWLTAMLLKKGTPVLYSTYKYNFLPVRIKNNETLISGNYIRNQKCIDAINNYYQNKMEERPFIDIPYKNL